MSYGADATCAEITPLAMAHGIAQWQDDLPSGLIALLFYFPDQTGFRADFPTVADCRSAMNLPATLGV